ncbi:hypothetical protein JJL45_02590 [Tamlana sp. s12]|uniref:hypothetical protein n=1 Tax=Tamlana sp. s12 TaxID=1630406 RepID=UPI0007FD1A87|nr:hypothetical protein [Tamlana sp. s12]OBQ56927.1 hypothetical protein VQ01_00080 [Tamlana sp. s12]QQY82899.1 hypothetical protein JJL45_02590 [Tamlana sp. s12]
MILEEFKSLQSHGIYSIDKVEWWLLKHETHYKNLKGYWYCPNPDCLHRIIQHCSCKTKHDEFKFLELFEALDKLSNYRKSENYAKQELIKYHTISHDEKLVAKWLEENDKVGEACFFFLFEHQGYDSNPVHLLVVRESLLGYRVYVDSNDFKGLIEFMEIFIDLKYKDDDEVDF